MTLELRLRFVSGSP